MSWRLKLRRLKEKIKRALKELEDSLIIIFFISIEPEVVTI